MNFVNGNDLINLDVLPSSPTTGLLPMNHHPFQRNQYPTPSSLGSGISSGQLNHPTFSLGGATSIGPFALNTGVRTVPYQLGPPRVHLQTHVDHLHDYYSGLTEVFVTQVKTIRFLTPTSTADRLLQPSDHRSIGYGTPLPDSTTYTANSLRQFVLPAFRANNYNYMRNVPWSQSMLSGSSNFDYNFHQFMSPIPGMDGWSSTGQAPRQDINLNHEPLMNDQNLGQVPKQVLNLEPVSVYVPGDPKSQQIPGNINGTGIGTRTNRKKEESSGQEAEVVEKSADDGIKYDGRTHSISCGMYGPYKCPKCGHICPTSQHFASHTLLHYRNEETPEQRKRRHEARSRGLCFHLIQTPEGLTVYPNDEKEEEEERLPQRRRTEGASGRGMIVVKTEENGVQNQEGNAGYLHYSYKLERDQLMPF